MYPKHLFVLALLGLTLMSTTCEREREPEQINVMASKTWLHSYEEESGDLEVYRPNTYAFPPSRGRTGFSLEANGTFVLLTIAPTDGLEEHRGTWKTVKKNLLRVRFQENNQPGFDLELLSVEPDLLKLRKLNVTPNP